MSLTDLARNILANAQQLEERGVIDRDSKIGFRNLSVTDYETRARLIDTIQELNRLVLGPAECLSSLYAAGTIGMVGLHAVARYNIPSKTPDGGIKLRDLAEELKMDEQTLGRLIRQAIVHGVFQEPEPGLIAHSTLSRLMRDDPDWLHTAQLLVEQTWPTAMLELDALERWPGSYEPNHTGFNLANKTTYTLFNVVGKDPKRLKQTAGMFRALAQLPIQGPDNLTSSPLWKEIDKPGSKAVDIGGNRGYISQQLAEITKDTYFIVQDRPETVKLGEEELPATFRHRVSFKAHDFFNEQPIKGAQVYFFRKILHDWPDHLAVQIIRNIIPALVDGSYVVICDRILSNRATCGYIDKEARFSDLNMLMHVNGRERTEDDWKKLFAAADSRFKVEFEHWQSTSHGLIKALWKY